jgi:RimJ/RimL family protein N-acetyltransferase
VTTLGESEVQSVTDVAAHVFARAPIQVPGDLILDTWHEGDIEWLYASMQDPEIARWFPISTPYTRDQAASWPGIVESRRRRGLGLSRVIRVADHPVGSIDVHRVDWYARTAELSYWTEASSRCHLHMTRAVEGITRWLILDQAFERVELRMSTDNVASQTVAKHCHFAFEGVARNAGYTHAERLDLQIYSFVRNDLT